MKEKMTFIIANDLHYASPDMLPNTQKTRRMTELGDGKFLLRLQTIVDAFVSEVIRRKPDAVLLNGDLSFNGEAENHRQLALSLQPIRAAGIPVFVLPGNHDIRSKGALQVKADTEAGTILGTPTVTEDEFAEIYADYGYASADARDTNSLSYRVRLTDNLHLLMLDTSLYLQETPTYHGRLSDKTLQWMEDRLVEAREERAHVLVGMHHSSLIHFDWFYKGFTLDNWEELASLLERYHVPLTLSGHIHAQSIARHGALTDIATGSLSIVGNTNGVLDYTERGWHYEAHDLDLSEAFAKEAFDVFAYTHYRKSAFRLLDSGMTDMPKVERLAKMEAEGWARFFPGRFGAYHEAITRDPRWQEMIDHHGRGAMSAVTRLENAVGKELREADIPHVVAFAEGAGDDD